MSQLAAPRPRPRRTGVARAGRGYWPYLLPGAIAFVVVIVIPFATNFYYSLTEWKGGRRTPVFVGAQNYLALLGDADFWTSFRTSLAMIVAMVIVPTGLGLLLAAVLFDYLGKKFGSRAAAVLRATYYLPQVLPVAVAGILWGWILNSQTGALNVILRAIGVADPPDWLGSVSTALPAVMFVMVWVQIGYPVVIFMSALERVDPELYEAAEIDGAGWWQRFRAITLPQIKPETFVIVLTCTIAALKVFGPIYVLTAGGPESSTLVPSYYSYLNFFPRSRVGYGAAIANVLTVLIIAVSVLITTLQNRSARAEEEGR